MKITLNGQAKEYDSSLKLKNIIEQFCKDSQHVVAEVNGQIVRAPRWEDQDIADGDVVELVNIVGGG